ncbi:unnamed protein product [Adineta ricciae]|uniref:Uncharacterized protein n=1 Tax=Adineta ricciae TaxID=249248 RepID=A0A814EHS8_ADIRI|nr:unnamed protein product [Adineta ricciae]
MKSTTFAPPGYSQTISDELIGFDQALPLLTVGVISIVLVVVFGFILCHMDMKSDHSYQSRGIYVEN